MMTLNMAMLLLKVSRKEQHSAIGFSLGERTWHQSHSLRNACTVWFENDANIAAVDSLVIIIITSFITIDNKPQINDTYNITRRTSSSTQAFAQRNITYKV